MGLSGLRLFGRRSVPGRLRLGDCGSLQPMRPMNYSALSPQHSALKRGGDRMATKKKGKNKSKAPKSKKK